MSVESCVESGYLVDLMPKKPSRMAPLLIFDLDGTLYRTESSFVRTMRRVYEDHGVPYSGDAAVLGTVGETFATFLDWLFAQGFTGEPPALHDEISRAELDAIRKHGALYDGVPETLRELARRGCLLTLCTNGDRRYVDAVLTRGGIAGVFARLSALEADGRPKTERVRELMEAYPGRLPIVVGDRHHDLDAARANGCRAVGAAYGYARSGELDVADATITKFRDLIAVVERLAA